MGLFPSILNEASSNTRSEDKWIILEGPVDMDWIKNISSLLDGTKALTLANGERMLLPNQVFNIFINQTVNFNCEFMLIN